MSASNLHKTKDIKSISQLKLQLQNIIENIKSLEKLGAVANNLKCTELTERLQHTNTLIDQVEKAPTTKFLKTIQTRRNRRKIRKHKKKLNTQKIVKKQIPTEPTVAKNTLTTSSSKICNTAVSKQYQTKPHHLLRNSYNAQRLLRTFELLKILHLARGQDAAATSRFTSKFQNLRKIWNRILHENTQQHTQENRIDDQWSTVLFGDTEKSYYSSEHNMNDFLHKRRTWDSYLTSDNNGSSIPCGWVLPKEHADLRWQRYLSP